MYNKRQDGIKPHTRCAFTCLIYDLPAMLSGRWGRKGIENAATKVHDEYLRISLPCTLDGTWFLCRNAIANSDPSEESKIGLSSPSTIARVRDAPTSFLFALTLKGRCEVCLSAKPELSRPSPPLRRILKSDGVIPFVFSRARNSPRLSRYRFAANYKSSLRHCPSLSLSLSLAFSMCAVSLVRYFSGITIYHFYVSRFMMDNRVNGSTLYLANQGRNEV